MLKDVAFIAERVTGEGREPLVLDFIHELFAGLGVTGEDVVRWGRENGFDSEGQSEAGDVLVPGFPNISRIVWSRYDQVKFRTEELISLVKELERAAAIVPGAARVDAEALIELALAAAADRKDLVFGIRDL